MKKIIYPLLIVSLLIGCSKDGDINFFTKKQDVAFGQQMDSLVNADYNVLPRSGNEPAYSYLEGMMNEILASDKILYRDDFVWKITIIDEDVLNAFAAPGGYLYFYTGLMKYLDNGAHLAGVMAHEIAHADRRHSTEVMTKVTSLSTMLSILVGNDPSQLETLVTGLAEGLSSLAFTRKHETESDEYAVKYNVSTKYHPKGVSGFFEKLDEEDGGTRQPEFLSTHPHPDNRVENVESVWSGLGSPDGELAESEYADFKASLP